MKKIKWTEKNLERAKSLELGEYLKDIRSRHIGVTQELVAKGAEIPRCKLSQWENGIKTPSYISIKKLAGYYLEKKIITYPEYYAILKLHDNTVNNLGLQNIQNMK